jgi:hypothetical protein
MLQYPHSHSPGEIQALDPHRRTADRRDVVYSKLARNAVSFMMGPSLAYEKRHRYPNPEVLMLRHRNGREHANLWPMAKAAKKKSIAPGTRPNPAHHRLDVILDKLMMRSQEA